MAVFHKFLRNFHFRSWRAQLDFSKSINRTNKKTEAYREKKIPKKRLKKSTRPT